MKFQISDETSQDSIAATPKTENPFYQCPHCDDNFDSFDDVTNHIEDEHENNETGKNFVSFCVILCHFILNVTNHIEDEHENNETGKNFVSFYVFFFLSFFVILCHFTQRLRTDFT